MSKCNKCDKEAEYDSPELLCGEHWARWFVTNLADDKIQLTPEQEEEYYKEMMELIEEARKEETKP